MRTTDLAANRRTTRTSWRRWAVAPRASSPDEKTMASEARWAPDGTPVAYVSGGQLWIASPTVIRRGS